MGDGLLISIISGVTSISVAIITVVVKTWLDIRSAKLKSDLEELIGEEDLGKMIAVNDFIEDMRQRYGFDRVSICQFHNGGKFLNGKSMKKFSMTYEMASPGIEKIKRKYQNVMVSEFPRLFAAMLKTDFMIITTESTEYPDMVREMEVNGIVQSVKVVIRGLRGDILGFISCHNIGNHNKKVSSTLRDNFIDVSNQISGYLIK